MSAETLEWLNNNVLVGNVDPNNPDSRPWHYVEQYQGQLSNCYPGFIPVADVLSRLFDWQAVERPLYFLGDAGITADGEPFANYVPIENGKVIVNDKTGAVYGQFKEGYRIHQYNEWLVEYVAQLLDVAAGDLGIGAAGLLRNGGRAWVQVEPAHSRSVGGTILRRFLTASTSHDGTSASTYITGDHVAICDNTLAGALRNAFGKFRFKHTKNSPGRIAEVRQVLDISFAHDEVADKQIEMLMNTAVTDEQFWTIVSEAFPIPDKVEGKRTTAITKMNAVHGKFGSLWHHDNRVCPWKGTAWGTLMAFNTYGQWESQTRGTLRPERNMLNLLDEKIASQDNDVMALITKHTALDLATV